MARSIVLRFDSTCLDCGSILPAGSTARWFGRGRVSCCGKGAPGAAAGAAPAAPVMSPARALPPRGGSMLPPSTSDAARAPAAVSPAQRAALPPELAAALQVGCSPAHVAALATTAPNTRLLVRLQSGARFIVPAEHAAHVIRCVEESLVDKVRDVMGAAS